MSLPPFWLNGGDIPISRAGWAVRDDELSWIAIIGKA